MLTMRRLIFSVVNVLHVRTTVGRLFVRLSRDVLAVGRSNNALLQAITLDFVSNRH